MKKILSIDLLKEWRLKVNYSSKIAFVPTMGSLHEGHLSLIKQAQSVSDIVIVSIFINPIQFTDLNDYNMYPNNLEQDIIHLQKLGVDVLFAPTSEEVFEDKINERIQISYPNLMKKLCGSKRIGHFEGVLYIVYKLLSWVRPNVVIFGLKDYQQYLCISKMVIDLEIPTQIIGAPLIRDAFGLALSSRNIHLSKAGMKRALSISKTLFFIHNLFRLSPTLHYGVYKKKLFDMLDSLDTIDYAGIYNSQTLDELKETDQLSSENLVAIAGFIENIRLIDNFLLTQSNRVKG